jgi:hypothetical protein
MINYFEDKFTITSDYGEKFAGRKDFVTASAEEPSKLYYKIDKYEYIITYNDKYEIIRVQGLTEGTDYQGEELAKMENMGILQRFKNYDPRFIMSNFEKVKEGEYKQELPGFLGVKSYHLFKFNENGYSKRAYMTKGEKVTEIEMQHTTFKTQKT